MQGGRKGILVGTSVCELKEVQGGPYSRAGPQVASRRHD